MYIAYALCRRCQGPAKFFFWGRAAVLLNRKRTPPQKGGVSFVLGRLGPAHGLCGNVGRLPLSVTAAAVPAPPEGELSRLPLGGPPQGAERKLPAPLATNRSVAIHRNICYPRSAWDTMRESATKTVQSRLLCGLQGEQLARAIAFSRRKPLFSGGWPFPGSLNFLFT